MYHYTVSFCVPNDLIMTYLATVVWWGSLHEVGTKCYKPPTTTPCEKSPLTPYTTRTTVSQAGQPLAYTYIIL